MNSLLRKLMGRVFMDQSGADGGAGGGGGTQDGGQADAAAAAAGDDKDGGSLLTEFPAAGDDDQDAKPQGDELMTPEQRAMKAAEKDVRRPKFVPAKFWNAEKGEVNFEAWSKSTTEIETRMKDIGLPPKVADEYRVETPAALKDLGVDLEPDRVKAFKDEAFSAGLTQKQFDFVMGKYFSSLDELVSHGERYDRARTTKALMDHYKTQDVIQENVKSAYNVFSAYADEEEMKHLYRVCNDPIAIRVLAKINKELQEDPGVKPDQILTGESIDELMAKGSPYWDKSHPQHASIKAKVDRHFAAQANAAARKRAA